MSNRATRRATGSRRRQQSHELVIFTIDDAIQLNTESPLPGLSSVLYGIRAEYGTNVTVGLCTCCQRLDVFV